MDAWREASEKALRAAVTRAVTPWNPLLEGCEAAFTPAQAAAICVDQCYLEAEDGAVIELEGYDAR